MRSNSVSHNKSPLSDLMKSYQKSDPHTSAKVNHATNKKMSLSESISSHVRKASIMNFPICHPTNANWVNNPEFRKQLKKDNIDAQLFIKEITKLHDEDCPSPSSVKGKILNGLGSNAHQITLSILILVDALIVLAEIILEFQLDAKKIFTYNTFSTDIEAFFEGLHLHLPPFVVDQSEAVYEHVMPESYFYNQWFLKQMIEHIYVANISTKIVNGDVQDLELAVDLHYAGHYLHIVSLVLLAFFIVEIIVKIACKGRRFFREVFEVIDAVIVVTSFIFDLVIICLPTLETTLMTVVLVWRIIRVINSIVMNVQMKNELRIRLQKAARNVAEDKCEDLQADIEMQEKYISALQLLVKEFGGSQLRIDACKPKVMLHSLHDSKNALKSMVGLTSSFVGSLLPIPKILPASSLARISDLPEQIETVYEQRNNVSQDSCSSVSDDLYHTKHHHHLPDNCHVMFQEIAGNDIGAGPLVESANPQYNEILETNLDIVDEHDEEIQLSLRSKNCDNEDKEDEKHIVKVTTRI